MIYHRILRNGEMMHPSFSWRKQRSGTSSNIKLLPNQKPIQYNIIKPITPTKAINQLQLQKTTSDNLKGQESNIPSNFSTLETWHRYIKKIIGTYGFLDNPDLEPGPNFVGSLGKGCYFCRLDNHTHKSCGPLQEYKWLALAAKSNSIESTSTARDNVVTEGNTNLEDNATNNNVNNYVGTIRNTISIKPNIVSSSKVINTSFSSHNMLKIILR